MEMSLIYVDVDVEELGGRGRRKVIFSGGNMLSRGIGETCEGNLHFPTGWLRWPQAVWPKES